MEMLFENGVVHDVNGIIFQICGSKMFHEKRFLMRNCFAFCSFKNPDKLKLFELKIDLHNL